MAESGPNRKVASSLVALSSAAILAVYAAGYVRTRRAADRFHLEAAGRKRVPSPPGAAVPPSAPFAPTAVPATPGASASPDQTSSATPRSRPTATARRLPPSANEATKAAVSALPAESPVQMPPLERETTPPAVPKTPALAETQTVDGDEPAALPAAPYRDGAYSGWGACRHGDLQAEVVIEQGRIVSARIAKCLTRYPCSWVDRLLPEVVSVQGPPVTYVSGASESSDAFYYAVMDALSHAK